jgi:hypothetical protein
MCTLFVHDRFYTPVCFIDRVEGAGPRGVTTRLLYEDETYTIYAHGDILGMSVLPRNDRLYRYLVYALSLIHHAPEEHINLEELQKELAQRGLFCTLPWLDVLRKWRQSIM